MSDLRHPRVLTRHHRERVVANRLRFIRDYFQGDPFWHKTGYAAKQHPLDCGNARCGLCHNIKRFKPPRQKRWDADA